MQYEIKYDPFPAVVCTLQPGEQIVAEGGGMSWMDDAFAMETRSGGVGKAFSKALSGESMFQNIYTARGAGMITFGSSFPGTRAGSIAFSSCFPGTILPIRIVPGHDLIVQKGAFLACEAGVELSMSVNKKLSAGLLGGEGFIMQRLSGSGIAFLEVDGSVVSRTLAAGERLVVSSGNVLGFVDGVGYDVELVKGAKNMFLGGEGLANTILTGPGNVWLQTMPRSALLAMAAR